PLANLRDQGEVDRVLHARLPEGDMEPAFLQQVAGLAAEADRDDGVVGAVSDVRRHPSLRLRIELPATDHRVEAAHHQQPGRPRLAHPQRDCAGDGGALAEAADYGLLPGNAAIAQLVVEES